MVTTQLPYLFSMNKKCQAWSQGTWVQDQSYHLIALWPWASYVILLTFLISTWGVGRRGGFSGFCHFSSLYCSIRLLYGGKPMMAFSSEWFSPKQRFAGRFEAFALAVPSTWNTSPPDICVTYCLTFSKVFLHNCHFPVYPHWPY